LTLVILGDGAVGRGLAVALSGDDVFLAGPPGTPRSRATLEARGFFSGRNTVETGDIHHAPRGVPLICALKAYSIAGARDGMRAAKPLCILSVTNGLELWESWGDYRPEPVVLTAGFRMISSQVVASPGKLLVKKGGFGETILHNPSIPLESEIDIEALVNAKWLVNSVINPLGALTGLPNNRLLKAGLGPLVERLFKELSRAVPENCHTRARAMLGYLLEYSGNHCSMLQDVQAGRPTELPWLTGIAKKRLPGRCPTADTLCMLLEAKA